MTPGFPSDLVSARKAARIAWIANERGRRNVFTAAAPAWKPVRLTGFRVDDGVVLSDRSLRPRQRLQQRRLGGEPEQRS